MAPRVKYVLFKARYGWVAVVGLLIAAALFYNGALVAGATALLVTVIASVGTYVKVDRPIVNELPTSG